MGTVTIGGLEIDFSNLAPVDLSGFTTVTVASPANAANALVLNAGFDSATGNTHRRLWFPATTGLGMTGIESAHLWNDTNVIVDTSATTGSGSNTITVRRRLH